jgi:hypothetical protein
MRLSTELPKVRLGRAAGNGQTAGNCPPPGDSRAPGHGRSWRSRLHVRHRREIAAATAAALLATAFGFWVLRLWDANIEVPFLVGTDATLNLAVIKDTITHGWFLTNPNLAAPFGQELYDFPAWNGDTFYMLIIKLLGIPFSNPAVVMNVYFLLGFPLIALTSFAVLRRLGISVGVAIVCAVLFTELPSHFYRGELHIFLGAYFMVPICCYLVLALLAGNELFGRGEKRRGLFRYLTWRTAGIALLCLVVGSSDTYFASFTVALMLGAALFSFLATRSRRALACGLAAAVIVLGGMGVNELPTLIYTAEHGKDTQVGQRVPAEGVAYSLSLANLVLPIEGHRIPAFAELAKKYQSTTVAPQGEAAWDNLGLAGSLGLFGLILVLCARGLRGARDEVGDLRPIRAAVGAGMAFLIGTVGGLATLFAYIVSPQLRTPDRISIFIGFFAIFGVALGLDYVCRRWSRARNGRFAAAILLAAVLVLGVLDQTSPKMIPDYQTEIANYRADGAFVHEIETQVPPNAAIYQLPYEPFPEYHPVGRAETYDSLIGYLHSNNLRWTAGALVGRSTDWEGTAGQLPLASMLEEVSAAGFSGVYIDTYALGEGATALPAQLRAALGVTPLVSPDGRLYFFNMNRYNQQLRSRRSATQLAQLARNALYPEG